MKKVFLVSLITVICGTFLLNGCVTQQTSAGVDFSNSGRFGEQVITPAKDFESRGLVFTETRFQISSRGTINGDTFTYQALLREAQRAGADAIINVTIDKRVESITQGSTRTRQEVWYGSALAIRYTNMLRSSSTTTTPNGTTHTGETIHLNGGRSTSSEGGSSVGNDEQQQSGSFFSRLFGR